jgi:hypothetical protein
MARAIRVTIGVIEVAGLLGIVASCALVIFGLVQLLAVLEALGWMRAPLVFLDFSR